MRRFLPALLVAALGVGEVLAAPPAKSPTGEDTEVTAAPQTSGVEAPAPTRAPVAKAYPDPPGGCTLEAGAALSRGAKYPEAAEVLFCALDKNAVRPSEYPEARRRLGECLERMGLPQSAAYYYTDAVHGGPDHADFEPALTRLVALLDQLHDDPMVVRELSGIPPRSIPAELRRDIGYFYAQLFFRKDDLETAKSALLAVTSDSPYFRRARYLEGLLIARETRLGEKGAIAAFQAAAAGQRDRLGELSQLAIGRVLYGEARYAEAAKAFQAIKSTSGEPLFDSAWALYKAGDFEAALRALDRLRSGEYAGYYRPEALLLEGLIYDAQRRFPDRGLALNRLLTGYLPYSAKMKSFRKQASLRPPKQVYEFLRDYMAKPKGSPTFMPADLMASVIEAGSVRDVLAHIRMIEEEEDQISWMDGWSQSEVAQGLLAELKGYEQSLETLAGKLVIREVEDRDEELDNAFAFAKQLRWRNSDTPALVHGSEGSLAWAAANASAAPRGEEDLWPFPSRGWIQQLEGYPFTAPSE